MPEPTARPRSSTSDSLVRQMLLGEGNWLGRDDRQPADALLRRWNPIKGSLAAASWSSDVAELLQDPEVAVRAGAVWFFCYAPEASGETALNEAFLHHYERFEGHQNPYYLEDDDDIGSYLARAVALRVHDRTPSSVVERLREEALRPGRGHAVVAPMLKYDRAWVVEHMEAVVAQTPRAFASYLAYNRSHRIPFDGILERVAHHVAPNELARLFRSFYGRDPETQSRLRALVGLDP